LGQGAFADKWYLLCTLFYKKHPARKTNVASKGTNTCFRKNSEGIFPLPLMNPCSTKNNLRIIPNPGKNLNCK
jgi:hypothetical protein